MSFINGVRHLFGVDPHSTGGDPLALEVGADRGFAPINREETRKLGCAAQRPLLGVKADMARACQYVR